MDFSNFANALGGLGAGMAGRGNEWQKQQMLQREIQNKKLAELDEKRKTAMLQDAKAALMMLKSGKPEDALKLAENRSLAIGKLGGDPTHTNEFRARLSELLANNAPLDPLIGEMESLVNAGVESGYIKPIEVEKDKYLESTPEGRARFLTPDGQVVERAIQGVLEKPKETLEMKDLRDLNKDVGALDTVNQAVQVRGYASQLDRVAKTKSPTDQLAAVFTFMKSLDPNSVVRNEEQQMVLGSGGVATAFSTYVKSLMSGDRLSPEVFDEMVATAKNLANQKIMDAETEVTGYLDVFGDKLNEQSRAKLLNRVPKPFYIKSKQDAAGTITGTILRDPALIEQAQQDEFSGFKILGVK